jgi:very-short-patch-repair endonuclease
LAEFWTKAPPGRVVRLVGVDAPTLDLVLESLPDEAPAVVTYRPSVVASAGAVVREALGELESLAISLFSAWLPEALYIEGQSSASVAAVRALAHQAAEHHESYGPFLAELAERAQRAAPRASSRIPAEVRAAGLAKVIAASLDRAQVAALIYLHDDLTVRGERSIVDACEWLAHHGGLAVWLTGAPLRHLDRISTVAVEVTGSLAEIVHLAEPSDPATVDPGPVSRSGLTYPAARGVPRTDHEKAVAAVLTTKDWASGHRWNHRLHLDMLNPPYVVDLFFEAERCIVEIDGDDHRRMPKFERDRRRDVDLQTAGYAVLRFTNDQVSTNLEGVLVLIQRFLDSRRHAERREQYRATR